MSSRTFTTLASNQVSLGFPGGSDGKEPTSNAGDLGSVLGSGRSRGGGHGNPLQYSCLKNSMESVMPSNHLILCRPLLLLPSILPSIGVFSLFKHIQMPAHPQGLLFRWNGDFQWRTVTWITLGPLNNLRGKQSHNTHVKSYYYPFPCQVHLWS